MLGGGTAAPVPELAPLTSQYGAGQSGDAHMASSIVFPWSFMWFGAALCVMVGAFVSFLDLIFSFEWIDALEMAYLFFFGTLLALVDTPVFTNMSIVANIRACMNRFAAVLTRVTGKGIVYCFLGCTLWSSMWSNLEGTFLTFLAFFLGIAIFLTGLISVGLGAMKSHSLNLVRSEFRKDSGGASLQQLYSSHARLNPATGLTPDEFNRMAPYARGVQFEASDLKFIFNALSSDPKRMFISQEDLHNWIMGTPVLI